METISFTFYFKRWVAFVISFSIYIPDSFCVGEFPSFCSAQEFYKKFLQNNCMKSLLQLRNLFALTLRSLLARLREDREPSERIWYQNGRGRSQTCKKVLKLNASIHPSSFFCQRRNRFIIYFNINLKEKKKTLQ